MAARPIPSLAAMLVLLPVALVLATGLTAGPAAQAHAYVEMYVPDDGAVLDEAPPEIRVTFDEDVDAPIAAIKVYDQTSTRVDLDDAIVDPNDPRTVIGHVDPLIGDGTYVVTWRALSLDGHTIIGSFVFSIGEVGTVAVEALADTGPNTAGWDGVALVSRVAILVGVLLSAGAGILFLRSLRHRQSGWKREKQDVRRLVETGAQIAVVASFVGLIAHAAVLSGGGWFDAIAGRPFADALDSNYGYAAMARILVLVPLAVGMRTSSRVLVLTLWALALATLALDGHSVTEDPLALMLAADYVHVVAAAVWFGGLVALAAVMRRRRTDQVGVAEVVADFSATAGIVVAALLVAGTAMSVVTVRASFAATSTPYGATLIAKVIVAAAIVAIAGYNRFRLVPRVREDATVLSVAVRTEAVLIVLALALTGVLVNQETAAQAAGIEAPFRQEVAVADGYSLRVALDPNEAGRNVMRLDLFDEAGAPAQADDLIVRLSRPDGVVGPIERRPLNPAPGRWQMEGSEFSTPGGWVADIEVAFGRFDVARVEVPIHVN